MDKREINILKDLQSVAKYEKMGRKHPYLNKENLEERLSIIKKEQEEKDKSVEVCE